MLRFFISRCSFLFIMLGIFEQHALAESFLTNVSRAPLSTVLPSSINSDIVANPNIATNVIVSPPLIIAPVAGDLPVEIPLNQDKKKVKKFCRCAYSGIKSVKLQVNYIGDGTILLNPTMVSEITLDLSSLGQAADFSFYWTDGAEFDVLPEEKTNPSCDAKADNKVNLFSSTVDVRLSPLNQLPTELKDLLVANLLNWTFYGLPDSRQDYPAGKEYTWNDLYNWLTSGHYSFVVRIESEKSSCFLSFPLVA